MGASRMWALLFLTLVAQQTLTTSQACVQFELAQPPDSPSHTVPYRAVAYHADLDAIVSSDFTANYLSIAQGGRVSIQG